MAYRSTCMCLCSTYYLFVCICVSVYIRAVGPRNRSGTGNYGTHGAIAIYEHKCPGRESAPPRHLSRTIASSWSISHVYHLYDLCPENRFSNTYNTTKPIHIQSNSQTLTTKHLSIYMCRDTKNPSYRILFIRL